MLSNWQFATHRFKWDQIDLRAARRTRLNPTAKDDHIGFRLVSSSRRP